MKLLKIVKFVLYGGLFAGIYYSAFAWLIQHDWPREDYTYCYLIPLVVLYLIWEKKKELAAEPAMPSWIGLVLLIPGILLFWVGDLAGELYSLYLSSWLAAVGILWLHIGWRKLKVIAFALFMVLTMFPLPNFLNTKLTFGLKLISSQIGVRMIQVYGMSAFREGNIIDLGFTQLQVVDACSGLRYLFPLLIMGILLAYFYRAALWKRILLVFSTIPLTVVTNSLRIALTGIIYNYWGSAAAEGFFHGFSGWLIFVATLGVLLGEMKVLSFKEKIFSRHQRPDTRRQTSDLRPQTTDLKNKTSKAKNKTLITAFFKPPQFVVASMLLIMTLVISAGVEFREKVSSIKPFNQFPLTVGSWEGTRHYIEQQIITRLDLTDYVVVDYQNGGKPVNFYVAWYESQRKGESIHSPETCLPGSGWEFRQAGTVTVPLFFSSQLTNARVSDSTPAARPRAQWIKVNRAIMEKSGSRQIAYFWFPARGRILTNAWEMKLYTFWDALTRQRTDGALVRLITPVMQGEQVEDAEKRLQEFTREIVPVLDEFIPN